MEKTTCFEDLPNEIIAKIMSHLTTKDLLINCALVSKTWNCFTKSPAVHRNIKLPNCQNLVEFLNCATMLDSLCLKTSELDPNCDDALLAIRNWSNLTSLTIKSFLICGCIVSPSCLGSLSSAAWWKNLSKINVTFGIKCYKNLIQTKEFDSAIQELGAYGNITHFDFGVKPHAENLVNQALLDLIKGPTFQKLKHLTIHDTYNDVQFQEIVMARKDTLENLCVSSYFDTRHQDPSQRNVIFLQQCQKLTSLIYYTYFPATTDITVLLPKLQNLCHLDIRVFNDFYIGQSHSNLSKTENMPSLKKIAVYSHVIGPMPNGPDSNQVKLKY